MAQFTEVAVQEVASLQNILFTDTPISCNRGYVLHRSGSGIFTLRGSGNQCRARYRVSFGANVAIPDGGTVGPISIALNLNGENLGEATAIVTPAAAGDLFNVYVSTFIDVPGCCCASVSVKNTGEDPIEVQNANLIIERVA